MPANKKIHFPYAQCFYLQESLRIFRSLSGGSHQQHVMSDDTGMGERMMEYRVL